MSHSIAVPNGTLGFDCNEPVSANAATLMQKAGYRFAVRYVPRITAHANDLTSAEVDRLHAAGLAVMPVQHVESETSWTPTIEKGQQYGTVAAEHAASCGILCGTTLWLDLEGVADTEHETIVAYCNAWYDAVSAAGFEPGIYVGWHALLTPNELYTRLKFRRYWGAFNLNADQYPAKRGLCMKQRAAHKPSGVPFEIDADVVQADALGGLPTACAPDEWGLV